MASAYLKIKSIIYQEDLNRTLDSYTNGYFRDFIDNNKPNDSEYIIAFTKYKLPDFCSYLVILWNDYEYDYYTAFKDLEPLAIDQVTPGEIVWIKTLNSEQETV
ncbi:MAG: hypothetical protein KDK51_02365 [Deltaproteobacteria bacterium]|nr:hypothetical protein [Deltaproteobacteria bacterium]